MVRRILSGFDGDGNIDMTRSEADILFDIDDGTRHYLNNTSWSGLFETGSATTPLRAASRI